MLALPNIFDPPSNLKKSKVALPNILVPLVILSIVDMDIESDNTSIYSEDEEDISGTFTDESENEDDNEKISTICEHCGYEAATTKGLQRHIGFDNKILP